ncbi:MAG: Plug domain-containing protein, partial [Bacteroidales bacterium]|nr:Plug domain-containing protein [Bacteroidales bacterium]
MIPAAVIALFLQAPDTLAPAAVYSVKELPVVRAAEVVRVDTLVAAPQAVADLLRSFTGVQVKDYGGAGGLKTVNVRSLGSEHIGIFLDGIQVDNAQNMQVDLGRFSTEGLGSVSLYNG